MAERHKHCETIKAWAEGKTIQKFHVNTQTWVDILPPNTPLWASGAEYRVKPEVKVKPYTWDDREILRDKWIKDKKGVQEYRIDNFVNTPNSEFKINGISAEYLLSHFTFLDGSPCGIVV